MARQKVKSYTRGKSLVHSHYRHRRSRRVIRPVKRAKIIIKTSRDGYGRFRG